MNSELPTLSFHELLKKARDKAQSRNAETIEAGIAEMNGLKKRFRYAVQIEQELALAHIEMYSLPELRTTSAGEDHLHRAASILKELREDNSFADEETLGKTGRLIKERAWRVGAKYYLPENARRAFYEEALNVYKAAYEKGKAYYPGINVAMLQYVLGHTDDCRITVAEVLKTCNNITPKDDVERNWVFATEGEAWLLSERHEDAADHYRMAMRLDPNEAQAESPRRHALCILGAMHENGICHEPEETSVLKALGLNREDYFN